MGVVVEREGSGAAGEECSRWWGGRCMPWLKHFRRQRALKMSAPSTRCHWRRGGVAELAEKSKSKIVTVISTKRSYFS